MWTLEREADSVLLINPDGIAVAHFNPCGDQDLESQEQVGQIILKMINGYEAWVLGKAAIGETRQIPEDVL